MELNLSPDNSFIDGDTIIATCIAKNIPPLMAITWMIGEEILKPAVKLNISPSNETFSWPWNVQPLTQSILLKLKLKHDGLELRCLAAPVFVEYTIPDGVGLFMLNVTVEESMRITVYRRSSLSFELANASKNNDDYEANYLYLLYQSDVALSECQFQINEKLLDFSEGASFQYDGSIPELTGVSYHGDGLQNGHCGILVHINKPLLATFGCRARDASGGWVYEEEHRSLLPDDSEIYYAITVFPPVQLVDQGCNTSFLCSFQQYIPLLEVCEITDPAMEKVFETKAGQDTVVNDRFGYYGGGLNYGYCGVSIHNVSDDDNGIWRCFESYYDSNSNRRENNNFGTIIVKKPPSAVELSVSGTVFIEGDTVQATCVVRDSRPAALVTWYLGDEILRKDAVNDERHEIWRWSWELQTTSQNISILLNITHDSLLLRCVAEHSAWNVTVEDQKVVYVDHLTRAGYEETCGFGFYKLHDDVMTYDEAEATCEAEGTRMALVNSDLEHDVITTLLKRQQIKHNQSDYVRILPFNNYCCSHEHAIVHKNDESTFHNLYNRSTSSEQEFDSCKDYNISLNGTLVGSPFVCKSPPSTDYTTRHHVNRNLSAEECFLHELSESPIGSEDLEIVINSVLNQLQLNNTYVLAKIKTTSLVSDVESILENTLGLLAKNCSLAVIMKPFLMYVMADVGRKAQELQEFTLLIDADSLNSKWIEDAIPDALQHVDGQHISLCFRKLFENNQQRLMYSIYFKNRTYPHSPIIIDVIKPMLNVIYVDLNNSTADNILIESSKADSNSMFRRTIYVENCVSFNLVDFWFSTNGCVVRAFKNVIRMCRQDDDVTVSDDVVTYLYVTNIYKPRTVLGVKFKERYQTVDLVKIGLFTVSFLGLLGILMTGVLFKEWRQKQSNQILLHMSLSSLFYLVLNMWVLVFEYERNVPDFQRNGLFSITFLFCVRYSVLTQCTWMLVLSTLQLKRLLTVLGSSTTEHLILKVALLAWVIPLLPVIVVLAWEQFHHVLCFNNFIVFCSLFVGPKTFVVIVNNAILVYVAFHVCACCGCGEKEGLKRHGITDWTLALRRLKQTVFLVFLFGIPATFELLYEYIYRNEILNWLYFVPDSLQGVLLFVFFILADDDCRSKWRNAICK